MELATESIPDLVISDVMMPVMDGLEMCSKLKSDERTSHIPVIMLTARADRGSKLEGLETGADDYIIKPFDAEELQVRVKNLIEQRKRLREKFMKELLSDSEEMDPPPGDQLLERLITLVTSHIADPEFMLDQLSDELNMGRSQMFRKSYCHYRLYAKGIYPQHEVKKSSQPVPQRTQAHCHSDAPGRLQQPIPLHHLLQKTVRNHTF